MPIQMGARLYLPGLGRFTQVDPILGGTANNYVYVLDPVNGSDYGGLLAVVATFFSATGLLLQGGAVTALLQPANTVTSSQPATNGSSIQRARNSAALTPVRAVASVNINKIPVSPNARTMAPSRPSAVAGSGVGGAISGVWDSVRNSPIAKAAGVGCAVGAGQVGAIGLGADYITNGEFEITPWAAAGGCLVEGSAYALDSFKDHLGVPLEELDTTRTILELYEAASRDIH